MAAKKATLSKSAISPSTAPTQRVNARLPGRACVTLDDSDSLRPSDKSGIIARGDASRPRIRAGIASIAVDINSTTTWNGFRKAAAA